MKNLSLFISLFLVSSLQAQTTISRQLIGSTGGSFANATIDVNYSAGEAVITTVSSGSRILTQGFQQPDFGVGALSEVDLSNNITVFPNPTNGELNILLSDQIAKNGTVLVDVYNLQGRLVFHGEEFASSTSGIIQLDLASLNTGQYLIRFTDSDGALSRAKFVKH
ncbi:MAG: hypothetical protein ACI865_001689 [Flavobacteriaceae bacterium]|jgi:hypothetical protein